MCVMCMHVCIYVSIPKIENYYNSQILLFFFSEVFWIKDLACTESGTVLSCLSCSGRQS